MEKYVPKKNGYVWKSCYYINKKMARKFNKRELPSIIISLYKTYGKIISKILNQLKTNNSKGNRECK